MGTTAAKASKTADRYGHVAAVLEGLFAGRALHTCSIKSFYFDKLPHEPFLALRNDRSRRAGKCCTWDRPLKQKLGLKRRASSTIREKTETSASGPDGNVGNGRSEDYIHCHYCHLATLIDRLCP
jgi:hypothetical protein